MNLIRQTASEIFNKHSIPSPNSESHSRVLPVKAFKEATGVDVKKHPLFFRSEIFVGGRDYNIYGWDAEKGRAQLTYFTLRGLEKALVVLNTEALLQKKKGRARA